ncbi:MAG: polysaccharide export protein [Rhodospirillales bacterium]|nr:polysaccharide export protein [Rhodospirillales bacterium]
MRGLLAVFLLLSVLGLAACSGPGNLPPVPQMSDADYRLGAGDQVRIITFGDEQLTGEFRVKDDGTVSLPLLGAVKAAGLTTTQLGNEVASTLTSRDLYRNPSVSVEVTAYRPVFVLGEVARPGQYPYQPGMTVVTAVAVAGGFTYRAVENAFKITRTLSGKPVEGRATPETPVRPGDVINVYERSF